MKRGRLSTADKDKILSMFTEGKTLTQIARKLDRSENFIAKYIPSEPPAPEAPATPKMATVGDIIIPKGKEKGSGVVMTEAASQVADETRQSGLSNRFTDCITKVDPTR